MGSSQPWSHHACVSSLKGKNSREDTGLIALMALVYQYPLLPCLVFLVSSLSFKVPTLGVVGEACVCFFRLFFLQFSMK